MTSRRTRSTLSATLLTALLGGLLGAVPVAASAAPPSAPPSPQGSSGTGGTPSGVRVLPETRQVPQVPVRAVRTTDRPAHVPAPGRPAGRGPERAPQDVASTTGTTGVELLPAPMSSATTLTRTADISVTYTGFSPVAQAAFQSAIDIISTLITAPVPITIDATFTPLDPGTLGSAGPAYVGTRTNAPAEERTWYPAALLNQLEARDTNTSSPDVRARFNSSFLDWYYGTDGNPAFTEYDFKSVVLHEVWHGLGFVGSASAADDGLASTPVVGEWGISSTRNPSPAPLVYDRFVRNTAGASVLDTALYPNPSLALGSQLVGNGLRFVAPNALRGNGGLDYPPLYAPNPFEGGSSFSHLSETGYPRGTANALMTPALSNGESIHTPGAVSLGLFKDLGWNTRTRCPPLRPHPSPSPARAVTPR